MPETRDDEFVCFVHGHGASFSSTPHDKTGIFKHRPLSVTALTFARERAAAQLAYQREHGKTPEKK